jgi:hypothetical protein
MATKPPDLNNVSSNNPPVAQRAGFASDRRSPLKYPTKSSSSVPSTVQSIGRYYLVVARISSTKGLTSITDPETGQKTQVDPTLLIKKRVNEGITLGECLGQNASGRTHLYLLNGTSSAPPTIIKSQTLI